MKPWMRRMLGMVVLAVLTPTGSAAAPVAEILDVQGQGERRATDTSPWLAAQARQTLDQGAWVRTLAASKIALLFADQTQLRLAQNSVLRIQHIETGPQPATLRLNLGRIWAQSKRAPGGMLQFETPAAVAAIRGTDWVLDVDAQGRTLLTVGSGEVELRNALGSVRVGSQEAALAEVGRAPVKIALTQARHSVQWVSALSADPLRHIDPADVPVPLQTVWAALARGDLAGARAALAQTALQGPWAKLLDAAWLTLSGRLAQAQSALDMLLDAPGQPLPAAYPMRADLHWMQGDFDAAEQTLNAGLARYPRSAALLAHLARTQLLADRLDDSANTLARPRDADTAAIWVAQGDWARRQGQRDATLQAFERATRVAPQDDRGWYGLGSTYTELEDYAPARAALTRAVSLKPDGPGYQGERGTLETLANRFDEAEQAFAAALATNPADYVALTGLGLLRLKQGRNPQALDAFLRAGVMEPRYARAKTYTAVAYYRLGRRDVAIQTLAQASALDDKDPLPYLFLSQMYTDQLAPGPAVDAARQAVQRLPYLKSLNQLASNQRGSANFGAALAFFGLEDWALELARRSERPDWGASHLFLADRYAGEFNKNSELFQGFLADPLAFGASNRFSTLLQSAGHYGQVEINHEQTGFVTDGINLTLNGLSQTHAPLAYFVQLQPARVTRYGLDVGVSGQEPKYFDPTGDAALNARVSTLGLGLQASERLGLFAYHNDFVVRGSANNQSFDLESPQTDYMAGSQIDIRMRQSALGASLRWSPHAQTWIKLGESRSDYALRAYPASFTDGGLDMDVGLNSRPIKRFTDLQLRHHWRVSDGLQLSVGLEHVREAQDSSTYGLGLVRPEVQQRGGLGVVFGGLNDITRQYTAVDATLRYAASTWHTLDAGLAVVQRKERVQGSSATALENFGVVQNSTVRTEQTLYQTLPRLGWVFQSSEALNLRLAYQDWIRPLSVSTLTPIHTAGIALDDRLLAAGGRLKRTVAQLNWTPDARTYGLAQLDWQTIANPSSPGVDLRTPTLPFLEALRNAQSFNLASIDLLEGTPDVLDARVRSLTLAVNHLLNDTVSVYGKYLLQDSRSALGNNIDLLVPYMPRHTLALGVNGADGRPWQWGARLVYRGLRYEDAVNLTPWPANWALDLMTIWNASDKRWAVAAGLLNLGGKGSERQFPRYVAIARYRF